MEPVKISMLESDCSGERNLRSASCAFREIFLGIRVAVISALAAPVVPGSPVSWHFVEHGVLCC